MGPKANGAASRHRLPIVSSVFQPLPTRAKVRDVPRDAPVRKHARRPTIIRQLALFHDRCILVG